MNTLSLKYDGRIPRHLSGQHKGYKSQVMAKMWKSEIIKNIHNLRFLKKCCLSPEEEDLLKEGLKKSFLNYRHHWRDYLTYQTEEVLNDSKKHKKARYLQK